MMLGAFASADRTSARADIDLDPGSRTVVTTGREAVGAVHAAGPGCSVVSGTCPFCRSGRCASVSGTVALMCGRYASTRSAADLATLFEAVDETDGELVADFNIAPTDPAPIVRQSSRAETPVVSVARWGLVPAWSRDASGAARMINARAETVATSKAFARSFAERRCLVPADGWYEWRRLANAVKQPYFMTHSQSLVFGGIWTSWTASSGHLLTFSILTLPAEGDFALIHDRMPLVLEPSHWVDWLRGEDPAGLLTAPSVQYRAGIEFRPVSHNVGDVRNDGPDLVRRVAAPPLNVSTMDPTPTLF
jgi:putative SOS response-associated peptidase YedK